MKNEEQYFFHTDQLTVGYDGKPLIREINIQLKKGRSLRSSAQMEPENLQFLRALPGSLQLSAALFIWTNRR